MPSSDGALAASASMASASTVTSAISSAPPSMPTTWVRTSEPPVRCARSVAQRSARSAWAEPSRATMITGATASSPGSWETTATGQDAASTSRRLTEPNARGAVRSWPLRRPTTTSDGWRSSTSASSAWRAGPRTTVVVISTSPSVSAAMAATVAASPCVVAWSISSMEASGCIGSGW
ncbi:MAG: hypothetical protein R2755_21825 [Acidimicrobiales bacterium]